MDLGNPAALQLTGSMTISAWINSSSFPVDDAAIVSKRTGSESGLYFSLEGFPADVNRWDSQGVKGERFLAY